MFLIDTILTLIKLDYLFHTTKHGIRILKMGCMLTYSLIEYGKQKSEVIWPRNTPPNIIEEVIKLDFIENINNP